MSIRLLLLNELIELFIDGRLVISTCTAEYYEDYGHERIGVMDQGGEADWHDLVYTPLAMSDARKFW